MSKKSIKPPWVIPSDAPVIEQSIHDYIVSIFSQWDTDRDLEIIPISPGAESSRGWDAAVKEAITLFFQYKLPDFLQKPSESEKQVFLARRNNGFDDSGGLFRFPLRAKAKGAPQSQHDLLVDLWKKGEFAFYVSTLFTDRKKLRKLKKLPSGKTPYKWGKQWYFHVGVQLEVFAPFFDELICIPPCSKVENPPERHKYFYNYSRDTSLHSEPIFTKGIPLLNIVLDQMALLRSGPTITEKNADAYVNKILGIISFDPTEENKRIGPVQEYYNQIYSEININEKNLFMTKLRALALVMKPLTGLEMMITQKLENHGH